MSLVRQSEILSAQFDAVVANPPYMGGGGMNALVKKFAKAYFPDAKSDLFACFIERGFILAKPFGHSAMVTMQSWMFLSSFETMRERMLQEVRIRTMAHLGARAFGSISGEVVQTVAYVAQKLLPGTHRPVFFRLLDGGEEEKRNALSASKNRYDQTLQAEFKNIPGSPIAYWVSTAVFRSFQDLKSIREVASPRKGLATCDDARWLRCWQEVNSESTQFPIIGDRTDGCELPTDKDKTWFPLVKGGPFRKWYGNNELLINWRNNGTRLKESIVQRYGGGSHTKEIRSEEFYFQPCLTWSDISSFGVFAVRECTSGYIISTKGCGLYPKTAQLGFLAGLLNSAPANIFLSIVSPTVSSNPGDVAQVPVCEDVVLGQSLVLEIAQACVAIACHDWNAYERSWDFQSLPLLTAPSEPTSTLGSSYNTWITQNRTTIAEMKRLEEENNRIFIDAYGLADELTPDVPIEQITLTVNPAYRYGGKMSEDELWTRFREDTCAELVSYAVGCMLGRYSLDEPGLIYAHSGNQGFDPSRYTRFPADADGILPLTDKEWFADDAANRLIEFISVAWDKTHLEANLRFLADNLSPKKTESSRDTLRRYLCDNFFKDHLQTYKKRPIYWLFSSGKQKAFQCLVYLHRYNEGTLARMRTEYVIPLTAKLNTYANKLEQDIDASTSTAEKKALEKQLATLHNQQAELATFDEKLRHHADQRITLDLDDGVKVNYGQFGDLLAEVKAVTGDKSSDA